MKNQFRKIRLFLLVYTCFINVSKDYQINANEKT